MFVDVTTMKEGKLNTVELDCISENLPDKVSETLIIASDDVITCKQYILPRIKNLQEKDIAERRQATCWCFINTLLNETEFGFRFEKIPQECNHLDIFAKFSKRICFKDRIRLFFRKDYSHLFGYEYKNVNINQTSFFLGTIARNDNDDWKFYPAFIPLMEKITAIKTDYKNGNFFGEKYESRY